MRSAIEMICRFRVVEPLEARSIALTQTSHLSQGQCLPPVRLRQVISAGERFASAGQQGSFGNRSLAVNRELLECLE